MTGPPSTAEPVSVLVRRAQDGDPEAFDALVRWCYPRVYRWALVRTGDPDEADDVTQDVIAGLARTLPTFAGGSRFETWLYRVTANAAGSGLKLRMRRLALSQRRAPVPEASGDEESRRLASLHGESVLALVRALLLELPPQQRTVFDLADLQGFSAAEVAEALALEPATVRGHLMRARRAIRSRILARAPALAVEDV